MEKKHFLCCYLIYGALLVGSLIVGFIQPIPIYLEKAPDSELGTGLDLRSSTCTVDEFGRNINVVGCWHHYFKFRHILTQYFALDAVFIVGADDVDAGLVETINLKVTWVGRTNEFGMCDTKACSTCVGSWRERAQQRLDPTLDTNVAASCMPEACGRCNLQCYLCLRRVNPLDGTCKLYKGGGSNEIVQLNSSKVCNDEHGVGADDWNPISLKNQSMTRTISCPKGSRKCTPSVLFKTAHVEYSEFYFQVELDENHKNQHKWLETVDFNMRYRNPDFSLYEIGFRYGFLIINLLVW
jgi:hypothetical protein